MQSSSENLSGSSFNYFLMGGLLMVSLIAFFIFLRKKGLLFFFYTVYAFSGFMLLFSKEMILGVMTQNDVELPDFEIYLRVPEFLQMVGLWAYILFVIRLLDLQSTHVKLTTFLKVVANIMLVWGFLEAIVLIWTKDEALYQRLIGISSAILFPLFIGVIFMLAIRVKHSLIKYVVTSNVIFISVLLASFIRMSFFNHVPLSSPFSQLFTLPFATFAEVIVFSFAIAAKMEETNSKAIESEKKVASLEMAALRSQMNPHFIFNSMNSIRNLILVGENKKADKYLMRFSKLLRTILDFSRQPTVSLRDELETINLYIAIEASRFGEDFQYKFEIEESVELDLIEVPPLILQPFVENALIHGLMNSRKDAKELLLKVSTGSKGQVLIEIFDNGVGRKEARNLKKNKTTSYGTLITQERIHLFNKVNDENLSFSILDEDEGTRVIVQVY